MSSVIKFLLMLLVVALAAFGAASGGSTYLAQPQEGEGLRRELHRSRALLAQRTAPAQERWVH